MSMKLIVVSLVKLFVSLLTVGAAELASLTRALLLVIADHATAWNVRSEKIALLYIMLLVINNYTVREHCKLGLKIGNVKHICRALSN